VRIAKAMIGFVAVGIGACAAAPESGGPSAPAPARPAAAAAGATALAGTRWKGIVDPSVGEAATPWLEFTDGRVSGFSGCNLLSGGWKNEAGQVRLGPLAITKRGCLGPAGDVERRVMAVLNEQGRVTRQGDKLVITSPAGDKFEFVLAPV
jgi:heat shock protein HslJ